MPESQTVAAHSGTTVSLCSPRHFGTAAVSLRDARSHTHAIAFCWSNAGEVCGPLRVPQG